MNKKVELSILDPICDTYHHIGGGQAVFKDNPSIINWYLNESISMFCNVKFLDGYTTPELYIKNAAYWENPHFDAVLLNAKFINGCTNRLIRNFLDAGYFVFFGEIDDYYIEGKTWYKTRHFSHDGLITGYDQSDKTFTIFAYDKDWKYRQFKISQKSFEKARKAMYSKASVFKWYGVKPKKHTVELDLRRILDNLRQDLDPMCTSYSMWGEEKVCGIVVHDYIVKYFNKILDGSIPYKRIDWRVLRALWDHKKLMLLRIQAIEKALNLSNDLSVQYTKILEKTNNMRLQYMTYCGKRRDSILVSIKNNILLIRESERKIISALIEIMALRLNMEDL